MIFADGLLLGAGDRDAARAHELQHADGLEVVVQGGRLVGQAGLLDDREHLVHLHDARVIAVQQGFDVAVLEQGRGGHLVQAQFAVHDLVGRVEEDLDHVHALLDLLDALTDFLLQARSHDGDVVDAFHGGGARGQAPDAQAVAREHVRDLRQEADLVLGVDGHRIFSHFAIHCTIRFP